MEILNPTPIAKGFRLQSVDELKGFAMVLILLYHAGGVLKWDNWLHGEVGVDIFLMISAFTLVLTSRDLPAKVFLKRRLLRIYPSYWAAIAFFVIFDDKFFGSNYSATSIVLHVLGIHGFASGVYFSDISDSFWFISLILAMYLVFLVLRRRLADISYILGVGMLLTVGTCAAYIAAEHNGGLIQLAVRIPSFFLGLVAGQLWTSPSSTLRPSGILVAGLIAITYLGWFKGIIDNVRRASRPRLAMTAAFLLFARFHKEGARGKDGTGGFLLHRWLYSYDFPVPPAAHARLQLLRLPRLARGRADERRACPGDPLLPLGHGTDQRRAPQGRLRAVLLLPEGGAGTRPEGDRMISAGDLPVAILAGGMATRLKPITEKVPKVLVEVAGEPFFSHQIRLLSKAGLKRLVLCVGYLGEQVEALYGDGSVWGVSIEYSFDGPRLLGTGGALIRALPKLGDAFYVLYGDSYLPIDYLAVGRSFLASGKQGLMTVFANQGRFDSSNVWFENGSVRVYDKKGQGARA